VVIVSQHETLAKISFWARPMTQCRIKLDLTRSPLDSLGTDIIEARAQPNQIFPYCCS